MRPTLVTLSEEVVRWGFEIRVNAHPDWYLAFTNPTAGPWKRVMALSADGRKGEVLRFAIDEPRPDLILISDKRQKLVIVEAKTTLAQLANGNQKSKTVSMFSELENRLASQGSNEYWSQRSSYSSYLGLLWGPSAFDNQELTLLINEYSVGIQRGPESVLCIAGELINDVLSYQTFDGASIRTPSWFTF